MISVQFTVNGEKINKQIPSGWEDLTWDKFVALSEAGTDRAKVLSIVTGLDYEIVKTAKISNFSALMQSVGWVYAQFPEVLLPSKLTLVNGEVYDLKSLELNEYARYLDLENLIRLDPDNIIKKYPLIAATYIVTPYDYKQAEVLAERINLYAPCTEVMAIGNFTLANMLGLRSTTLTIAPPADTPLNRLKLALRNFRRRLAVTARYYSLRRKLPTSVRKYSLGR